MTESWRNLNSLEQLMLEDYSLLANKPNIITVCFTLSQNISLSWLRSNIIPRVLTHPRFSSRLTRTRKGVLQFQRIPDITASSPSLSEHFHTEHVVNPNKSPAERLQLFTSRLSEIISTPLDLSRPLWKVHLFPEWSAVDSSRDCCTMVIRVHHSISDGIGLIKFFLATVADPDSQNNSARLLVPTRRWRRARDVQKPSCLQAAREFFHDIGEIFLKTFLKDPPSVFTCAPVDTNNLCAIQVPSNSISVASLKKSAARLDITINDLLFTAFAGALHEYVKFRGEDPTTMKGMRLAMPFNKHAFDEFAMSDVSNRLLMLPVRVPIHLESREERMEVCASIMRKLKRGYRPQLATIAMSLLLRLPAPLRRKTWHGLASSVSTLFSNVPGPTEGLKIAGVDLTSIYFLPPPNVHVSVDFGICSYAGRVFIGVAGDAERLSWPEKLVELFMKELEELFQLGGTAT